VRHARQERWKPGRQRVDADRSASPEFQVTHAQRRRPNWFKSLWPA